jgi:hypothetical protein
MKRRSSPPAPARIHSGAPHPGHRSDGAGCVTCRTRPRPAARTCVSPGETVSTCPSPHLNAFATPLSVGREETIQVCHNIVNDSLCPNSEVARRLRQPLPPWGWDEKPHTLLLQPALKLTAERVRLFQKLEETKLYRQKKAARGTPGGKIECYEMEVVAKNVPAASPKGPIMQLLLLRPSPLLAF